MDATNNIREQEIIIIAMYFSRYNTVFLMLTDIYILKNRKIL